MHQAGSFLLLFCLEGALGCEAPAAQPRAQGPTSSPNVALDAQPPQPTLDAGAPTMMDAGAPAPMPTCPSTPWATYAHDAARTSASDGCIEGPLSIRWTLRREGTCGYSFRVGRILQVIGDREALFAAVRCGDAPAVMRVSPKGESGWTFSRADFGRGTWPAIAGDKIVSVDDGVFIVDRATGKWHGRELDVWGEPLVAGDVLLVDNTFQLDGAGPFLGAFDTATKWRWRTSVVSPGRGKAGGHTGGVAFADGIVVHAAAMGARSVPSLSGHDASDGSHRWTAPGVWPESSPSISSGVVFTVERWHSEKSDRLTARSLSDGSVKWSVVIGWSRGPAPVVAGDLVILHDKTGVHAYRRDDGVLAWSHPTPREAKPEEQATTIAAAMGSSTLVVTSGARVVVLSLEGGREQWSGVVVSGSSPTAIGGRTVERPVIIGTALYVTSDGALLRLDKR